MTALEHDVMVSGLWDAFEQLPLDVACLPASGRLAYLRNLLEAAEEPLK